MGPVFLFSGWRVTMGAAYVAFKSVAWETYGNKFGFCESSPSKQAFVFVLLTVPHREIQQSTPERVLHKSLPLPTRQRFKPPPNWGSEALRPSVPHDIQEQQKKAGRCGDSITTAGWCDSGICEELWRFSKMSFRTSRLTTDCQQYKSGDFSGQTF